LFRGWIPADFLSREPRILYVGQPTSGPFNGHQAERASFNGKGAFWRFARQIAVAAGCSQESIPCIAWSNLSKISCPQIAPDPSLIVDRVVRLVAEGDDDSEWNKSENASKHQTEADIGGNVGWMAEQSPGCVIRGAQAERP
jgi:hypothetical protein